jgi:hypothetical protein
MAATCLPQKGKLAGYGVLGQLEETGSWQQLKAACACAVPVLITFKHMVNSCRLNGGCWVVGGDVA